MIHETQREAEETQAAQAAAAEGARAVRDTSGTHRWRCAHPCSWCQSCPPSPERACRREARPPPGCSTAGPSCRAQCAESCGMTAEARTSFPATVVAGASPGSCPGECVGRAAVLGNARAGPVSFPPLTCCDGCTAPASGRSAPLRASDGARRPCRSHRPTAPPAACRM